MKLNFDSSDLKIHHSAEAKSIRLIEIGAWNQFVVHNGITIDEAFRIISEREASLWPALGYDISGFGLSGEFEPQPAIKHLIRLMNEDGQSKRRRFMGKASSYGNALPFRRNKKNLYDDDESGKIVKISED